MSATARLLGWCVAFGLTLSVSSVSAGPNVMIGGTHVSWIALGQTDQGDSAASRRDAEKWLKQAREAMKNGNLDIAEYCIERAEKVSVKQGSLLSHLQGHARQGAPRSRRAACRAGEAQRNDYRTAVQIIPQGQERQHHTTTIGSVRWPVDGWPAGRSGGWTGEFRCCRCRSDGQHRFIQVTNDQVGQRKGQPATRVIAFAGRHGWQ